MFGRFGLSPSFRQFGKQIDIREGGTGVLKRRDSLAQALLRRQTDRVDPQGVGKIRDSTRLFGAVAPGFFGNEPDGASDRRNVGVALTLESTENGRRWLSYARGLRVSLPSSS